MLRNFIVFICFWFFNLIVWLILFYYYYFLQLYCLIWCCLSLKFLFCGISFGFYIVTLMCCMYWESEICVDGYFYTGINFMCSVCLRGYKFWYFLILFCNRSRLLSYYVSLCWWRMHLNVCICIFVFAFVIVTVVVEIVIIDQG